jgi:hypothetical protein
MPSGFPGSFDNFTDPLANSPLTSPSHATLHSDVNDAVEKIETYMGLVKVIPTSVSSAGGTSATLAANGTVTIGTSNTSVTVSGAFSSLYDNYKIVVQGGTASSTSGYLTLQLGSTTANYRYDYISANLAGATPTSSGSVGAANFAFAGFKSTTLMMSLDVIGPFASGMTMVSGPAGQTGNNMGTLVGVQIDSTSFTSFIIGASTGTITGGTIRVYGYRN